MKTIDLIKDSLVYPLKGPGLITFFSMTILLFFSIQVMTLGYVLSGGEPVWMFAIPIAVSVLTGLFNANQKILHNAIDFEQPELRITLEDFNIFANTPARRTSFSSVD